MADPSFGDFAEWLRWGLMGAALLLGSRRIWIWPRELDAIVQMYKEREALYISREDLLRERLVECQKREDQWREAYFKTARQTDTLIEASKK